MWDKAHMPIPKAKSGKKLVSLMLSLNHWKSNPRVGWCFLLFFFQPDAGIFSNFLWKHLNCSYKHIFLIVRLLCRFTMSLHRSGFESWLSHLFRSCDSINWKKMEYLFSGMAVAIKIIFFFFIQQTLTNHNTIPRTYCVQKVYGEEKDSPTLYSLKGKRQ